MKKLVLFVLMGLSTTAFAQLQSNKNAAKLGYQGALDLGNGDKKFSLNFNSSKATLAYGGIANDGKGLLSIVLSTEAPVGKVSPINNKKADNWGSNCNVYKFNNLDSLLNFSIDKTQPVYSKLHQYWKPTNCIIDFKGDTLEQALIAYPGMYKKVNLGFQVSVDGGGLKSDISCELFTYDRGNTTKAATYKMIVSVGKEIKFGSNPLSTVGSIDTLTSANVAAYRTAAGTEDLYVIDNAYTTTLDTTNVKVVINIAQSIGKSPGYFNGKKVYVTFYTLGTGTNIEPGIYEPIIGIDNIEGTYAAAAWAQPAGVAGNSIVDHNDGNPVLDTNGNSDFSAGTPVEVQGGIDTPIKIYLTSLNRASVLDITEANDGGAHNPKFSFAATGAIKAKDAEGNYTIDVPYTYTPSDGTTKMDLKIGSPADYGIVNDTIEVTILANVPTGMTSTERLEITNGVRFWYDIAATGIAPSSAPSIGANAVRVAAHNRNIYAYNAVENVVITNIAGQTIKSASPQVAKLGISMQQGTYIVKTGATVQKVIVE